MFGLFKGKKEEMVSDEERVGVCHYDLDSPKDKIRAKQYVSEEHQSRKRKRLEFFEELDRTYIKDEGIKPDKKWWKF